MRFSIRILLLIISSIKSYSQCMGSEISYFPATVDGNITVTQTYTGDVSYAGAGNTWTNCSIIAGPTTLGNHVLSGSPFTQTLTFSSPVNSILYVLTAPDSTSYACETFTFTVNAGTLYCIQTGSACPLTQSGNTFHANGIDIDGTYIILASTIPYTSISVSGTGGANGSCMAICSTSFNGINSNNISTEYFNVYPNPANTTLKITCGLQLATCSLQDVLGNVIKTQEIKNKEEIIDISNLNEGIYFLQVTLPSGKNYKTKFIKQ